MVGVLAIGKGGETTLAGPSAEHTGSTDVLNKERVSASHDCRSVVVKRCILPPRFKHLTSQTHAGSELDQ
jgi:hypothetical protein